MDPGRRLIRTPALGLRLALGLGLGLPLGFTGCAALPDRAPAGALADAPPEAPAPAAAAPPPAPAALAAMAPIPNPPAERSQGRTLPERLRPAGPAAIAAANRAARARSRADAFVGGVQVFAYDPGRVYEVWTAPLRVTTLTLGPGETVVAKAAGDTVRWQIGETASGSGTDRRAHVMVKPLERGLETNLVLTTSRRVYLVQLKSGPAESFNAAVAWDLAAVLPAEADAAAPAPAPQAAPAGPLDARFRITPRGRRPAWTPRAVMTDGTRTFLVFPPGLSAREAPALFVRGPGGEAQLVNYRQQGGLWIVDRVFEAAELRVGDRRPQVVRIRRLGTAP